jgi:ketosteroid isomerase-like protein
MLLNRTRFLFLILFSFVLISCNEQDKLEIEKSAAAFDIKQGEASVLQTNQLFMKAFKARDSIGVSKCFTSDAKLMAPHRQPVKGRKDISSFISNLIKGGVVDFKFKMVKIWGDSSILVEEGTYEQLDKDEKQVDTGEYIALWQLESGNWKIYRNIWTSNQPASAIKVESVNMPSH